MVLATTGLRRFSCLIMSRCTRGVAVAVSAMIGTDGNANLPPSARTTRTSVRHEPRADPTAVHARNAPQRGQAPVRRPKVVPPVGHAVRLVNSQAHNARRLVQQLQRPHRPLGSLWRHVHDGVLARERVLERRVGGVCRQMARLRVGPSRTVRITHTSGRLAAAADQTRARKPPTPEHSAVHAPGYPWHSAP